MSTRLPFPLRCYRFVFGMASGAFRARYAAEAVESLQLALADERARRGRAASMRLWFHAMIDAVSSSVQDRRGNGGWLRGTGRDVVLAGRAIRRSPQDALVTIATLALAIGGVAAVFMIADPMLFRTLPYRDAGRIQYLDVTGGVHPGGFVHVPDFQRIADAHVFEAIMQFDGPVVGRPADLGADADALLGYRVSDGFFDTLGIGLARGRTFSPDEYAHTAGHTASLTTWSGQPVIITDELWRQLGHREDILGSPLRLVNPPSQSAALTVVGVLRPDFVLPDAVNAAPAFLVPGSLDVANAGNPRNVVSLYVRFKQGDTGAGLQQAQAILDGVSKDFPQFKSGRVLHATGLRDLLFRRVKVPLQMLLAVTGAVLLLAIANLFHLSLARVGRRAAEVALRRALGASRWRIVRMLLVESLVIVAAGAVAALGVGRALLAAILAVMPPTAHVYRLMPSGMNARVIAMVAVVAATAVIVLGLLPALGAGRGGLNAVLQSGSSRIRGRRRWRDGVLAALQGAVASSVLVVAVLLVMSFVRMVNSVTGIDESDIKTGSISWPATGGGTVIDRASSFQALQDAVARETGQRIGVERGIPGLTLPSAVWPVNAGPDVPPIATAFPMDRAALDAFRIAVVSGRLPTDEETRANGAVMVVDERAAELLAPTGASVLGMMVDDGQQRGRRTPRQIVGVVRRLTLSFGKPTTSGYAFMPPDPLGGSQSQLVWRGPAGAALVESIRTNLSRIAPSATLTVRPFEPFARRFGEPRLLARMTGVLGLLALVLTITGVYAVTSHTVGGRTSEIGVRMALGASASRVRRMIVREAATPAIIGVVSGLAAAASWAKAIQALVFDLTIYDVRVYVVAAAVVMTVVVLAAVIPASRASRVNPVEALRAS